MAAVMLTNGVEPLYIQISSTTYVLFVCFVQSSLRLDPIQWVTVLRMIMAWSVSFRGLNTSLPRCAHPESIELIFYE